MRVKEEGEEGELRYRERQAVQFSLPTSRPRPSLPWLTLATSDTPSSPHILLRDLGDDDIAGVMATVSTETRAIVLVNFSAVHEESLGRLLCGEGVPPVLVVTGREGVELARLVREGGVEVGVGVADGGRPHSMEIDRRGSSEQSAYTFCGTTSLIIQTPLLVKWKSTWGGKRCPL